MTFEEWWNQQCTPLPAVWNDDEFRPKSAWDAGRRDLLDPAGKTLPVIIAQDIVGGADPASIGLITDWLGEQGLLDEIAKVKIEEIKGVLKRLLRHLAAKQAAYDFIMKESFDKAYRNALKVLDITNENELYNDI